MKLNIALIISLALLLSAGCGNMSVNLAASTKSQVQGQAALPAPAELEAALMRELAARGIDPRKAVANAPGTAATVFDLTAYNQEAAGELPAGVQLNWSYRNPGDYDLNTEVSAADIAQIITFWNASVAYDDASLHDGVDYWPSGQPEDTGGAGSSEAPLAGSGAENWRRAQADGDSNGEIGPADIVPIAESFNVAIQQYNIYVRIAGSEIAFENVGEVPVVQPDNVYQPALLSYFFETPAALEGEELEFIVRPENTTLSEEGPDSNVAVATDDPGEGLPAASLAADPTAGAAPLEVEFTATVVAAPLTTIVKHEWDFDGDGNFDIDTAEVQTASHTYESAGIYTARLRATDSNGATALAGIAILAGQPPVATIELAEDGGEVPVTLDFEARQSYSPLSSIVKYEWDFNNDGVYEINRGVLSDLAMEFTEEGSVTAGLRVTDEIGLMGTTSVELTFTDDYEEVEPNSLASTATEFGMLEVGGPAVHWRCNIGGSGYNGDNKDWLAFTVAEGAIGNFSVTLPEAGAKLAVRLVDTDSFSIMHEASPVTASTGFSRGLRGAGTYFLEVENINTSTGANFDYSIDLELTALTYDETENNDNVAAANDLGTLNSSLVPGWWGNLGPDGLDGDDSDWYEFTLPQDRSLVVLLDFFHLEADLDLTLYDETGSVIYGVSESVTNKESISVDLAAGTYTIHCFRRDGGTANYELQVYFTS